jgi:hypothetical protein
MSSYYRDPSALERSVARRPVVRPIVTAFPDAPHELVVA